MKKKLLLLISGMYLAWNVNAQISQGGFPLSMRSGSGMEIPVREYVLPKLDKAAIKNEVEKSEKEGNRYMVGKTIPVDIKFPEAGTMVLTDEGTYIWKISISVPESKGIGIYCDQFYLPQGVKLFIHNNNKRHVLGAFDSENNSESNYLSIDAVQGEVAYVELNIPSYVDMNSIKFSIHELGAIFRGFEDLNYFSDKFDELNPIDVFDDAFFGRSSVCMININCPDGSGKETQRDATVQVVLNSGGLSTCSGTLLNNTGNTLASCTPYLLFASHCEPTNVADATSVEFEKFTIRFKYQFPGCSSSTTPPSTTESMSGVTFISRSTFLESPNTKGDFLLVKFKEKIPSSYNGMLNGWNKNPSIPTEYSGTKRFFGVHHPGGDAKAISFSKEIINRSIGASGTHWTTNLIKGYIAGGSSGSALFDNEGYAIGIASLAPDGVAPDSCLIDKFGISAPRTTSIIHYSKLSYCWENPGDADTDIRKLKPWLDPTESGVNRLGPTKANCATSTKDFVNEFNVTMNVFPNPSSDGKFFINIKLTNPTDLKFEVFDISGKRVAAKNLPNINEQTATIDLSSLSNGMYYIKLSNTFGYTSQKVVITK